jgi:hypothetical protein
MVFTSAGERETQQKHTKIPPKTKGKIIPKTSLSLYFQALLSHLSTAAFQVHSAASHLKP